MGAEDVRQLLASELLDDEWLWRELGLSRSQRAEFAEAYSRIEVAERPALTPFFDPAWYLATYEDVRQAGVDPFLHFLGDGIFELRSPHPLISVRRIYDDNRDLFYREGGSASLARVLRENLSDPNDYFDLAFYLERYPQAREFTGGALAHFMKAGIAEWLWPNPYFDPESYAQRYGGMPKNSPAALRHFIETGDREARVPSAGFDPEWYLRTYPDVVRSGLRGPLRHFLRVGRSEDRQPCDPRATRHGPPGNGDSPAEAEVVWDYAPIAAGAERYERARQWLADRRRIQLGSYTERDVRPCRLGDLREAIGSLAFPQTPAPKVSILIPCHNEVGVTVECLLSILASGIKTPYEVIIGDNASTEAAAQELGKVPGLRYFRHPTDLNFLRNCNTVFPEARGEYLLLLNNDAQLTPGALDILAAALDEDPALAAVGPQILYPNGRLQEAGCSVNRDGSTVMIGLFDDPERGGYNRRRHVDYISGAALLIRCSELDGKLFDDRFAPAYCEDLDLCLTLRARGKMVGYVPQARVVHHLSLTMAKESQGWKMRQIARNQHKLIEKWGALLDEINRVRVIAFYLPQFHPIAQNDLWWGAGFTEWTNVARARPSYAGHHQPRLPADLGFYDPRMPEVLAKQARLAARYGVTGFCVYYYRFGGMRLLEKPLETLLAHPEIALEFCICWANENWTRRWDGGDQELLAAQNYDTAELEAVAVDIARYIRDPRYITVDGKPLVLVYRPLLLPDPREAARLFRRVAAAEGRRLHLVYVESMEAIGKQVVPADIGFDAAVEFPPHGIGVAAAGEPRVLKEGWSGRRYDYEATVIEAIMRPRPDYARYPGVFPGWDNTARQPFFGTCFDAASPEVFQLYVEEKLAEAKASFSGAERLLFVNAWNEWAEGTYLEPDQHFGHRWLEALRNAIMAS